MGEPRHDPEEPRYGWVVVWACFTALAVIFGISYSFAAFFEPFAAGLELAFKHYGECANFSPVETKKFHPSDFHP